jgi:hypothetical protein
MAGNDVVMGWVKGNKVYGSADELRVAVKDANGSLVYWKGPEGAWKKAKPKYTSSDAALRAELVEKKIPSGAAFKKDEKLAWCLHCGVPVTTADKTQWSSHFGFGKNIVSFATFSAGIIWKLGADVTKESLYRDLCTYIQSTKSDHALIPNEFDLYDMWKDASLGRVRYGLKMSNNLGSLGLRILEKTPCAASVERAQSVQTDVITKKKFQISNELAEARIALRANAPGRNKRLEKRSWKVKDWFEATEYGLVKDGGGDRHSFYVSIKQSAWGKRALEKLLAKRRLNSESAVKEYRSRKQRAERKKK